MELKRTTHEKVSAHKQKLIKDVVAGEGDISQRDDMDNAITPSKLMGSKVETEED